MDTKRLDWNLTNHPPSPSAVTDIEGIRQDAKLLGARILARCPDTRERSLAITNLEQTTMWAVASIAREGGPE